MRRDRSLADRNRDREEARVKQLALAKRLTERRQVQPASTSAITKPTPKLSVAEPDIVRKDPPASPEFNAVPALSLSDGAAIALQPWAHELAETLLTRTKDKQVSLRLLWPAEIDSLAPLHAVASLSRVLQTDLCGLRTIFYPGTQTTRIALDRYAMPRSQLQDLWRSTHEVPPRQASVCFRGVLEACNDVELFAKGTPPPSLRQLIPTFVYDPSSKQWKDTKHSPLEHLLTKVGKLRRREIIRGQIESEWRRAETAPGALLILPRGIKRKEIKGAFPRARSGPTVKADVLLIDARGKSTAADPNAIRRLPDFLKTIAEVNGSLPGTLIVTDDPTEYFVLRHRLEHAGLKTDCRIIVAESEDNEWLASDDPRPAAWVPPSRSMINFSVSVIDQQAASLARRFGKIAEHVREESAAVEEPFRLAQAFVMRASHLPGGFVDLQATDAGEREYLARGLEWERVESLIQAVLLTGGAAEMRQEITDAIRRVHAQLAACAQATPLAVKLKEQVRRYAVDSREGLTIILSSPRNIAIAQRYLARELGSEWPAMLPRIDWMTLARAPRELVARSKRRRLVMVGLSPRIIRLLVTHEEVPTGTCVLVPAQKAAGVTQTLGGLVSADPLKPYRGRLSSLLTALNDRLRDIPDLEILMRSADSRALPPSRSPTTSAPTDPKAYHFTLEDGRVVQAMGTIFRYDGIEGEQFSRVQARSIEPLDFIFEMSDELRDEIEETLIPQKGEVDASPSRKLLGLYHEFVKSAVVDLFPAASRQASIRAIQKRMTELDADGADVSTGKLNYWITLKEDDGAPHGPRDREEFLIFCRALNIEVDLANKFWERIRRVRFENQTEGRQLKAMYAEILFSPESSQVYRRLSPESILQLRGKALECVFQVVEIEAPRQ
jgi:hypothetical protein